VKQAIQDILNNAFKVNQDKIYPNARLQQLLEAISEDFYKQVLKILEPYSLMELNSSEFFTIFVHLREIFDEWEIKFQIFVKDKSVYFCQKHEQLKSRLERIYKIREQHEKIKKVIHQIIKSESEGHH
jgi:hypothetical protein